VRDEREFLEDVERELGRLQARVQERAHPRSRHPDLEALLRLAWLEAGRRANREAMADAVAESEVAS
jgi:hypothetical protein